MGSVQLKGAEAMELFAIPTTLTRLERVKHYAEEKLRNHLPQGLYYHNLDHTLDVYQAAETIAQLEGIDSDSRELLLAAVCFHDLGFLKNNQGHEEISCQLAAEKLPEFNFTPAEIDVILGLIWATKIPQSPKNHLEEIIADADLDYLGRADFYSIGKRLFEELKFQHVITTETEWNRLQVDFLTKHRYFTQTSIERRKPMKIEHLSKLKSTLTGS